MNGSFHLISAEAQSSPTLATVGPALRLDTENPHLRLAGVTLFIADTERSLHFYETLLGFKLIADDRLPDGTRMVAVAPPDGTANLVLLSPNPKSERCRYIGQAYQVVLLTEDVVRKYQEWSQRGIRFLHAPIKPPWGGLFVTFEDPDGNTFLLLGVEEATRELEELRRRSANAVKEERRSAYEIELAREVQRKLLPQNPPDVATLDYASLSLPAGLVGGDYYDLFQPAPGQIGFVLADVVGKGVPAAVLMANLQAILRSHFNLARHDYPALLGSVNRLFYENTNPDHYATLFLALYDDAEGTLSYINCGHPPPLLVRSNGEPESLNGTATVLGLVPQWEGALSETQLLPGDTLLMYTDGITEAEDSNGDEFGVKRLLDLVRDNSATPASVLTDRIISAVNSFAAGEQQDDMTLVLAVRREALEPWTEHTIAALARIRPLGRSER